MMKLTYLYKLFGKKISGGWSLIDGPLQHEIPHENLKLTILAAYKRGEAGPCGFPPESDNQTTIVIVMPPESSPSSLTCAQLYRILLHLRDIKKEILEQALHNTQSESANTITELCASVCR